MISGFFTGPILPVIGTKTPNAITVMYMMKITDGSVLSMYTVNHMRAAKQMHNYNHNFQLYLKNNII
jgi:hypothetical protein